MTTSKYSIIAPAIYEQQWSEAEVVGSAVWLWTHSKSHRNFPLHTLPVLLLPAIKTRQFALVSENGQPVFYTSWANLSEEAERRYLANNPLLMPQDDWNTGDRGWILDIVAPFGHTATMVRLMRRQLLANRLMRSLYHRGNECGLKVKEFQGSAVLPAVAKEWFRTHPVAYPNRPAREAAQPAYSISIEE